MPDSLTTTQPTASDYIARKVSVPSNMRTADWTAVPAWMRERAFFSAAVSQAKTLQEMRDVVQGAVGGRMGAAEARKQLKMHLTDIGYQPDDGDEGTLRDLSSSRRMRVMMETNVAMARGWRQRQDYLGSKLYPAMQLYRAEEARVPRDWVERWYLAGEEVNWEGVAGGDEFIALTESPIWAALSDFGLPYPPFAFGSHMRLRPVRVDKARELGLVPPKGEAAPIPAPESVNASLEADVSTLSEPLRRQLADTLRGLARLQGDTLTMTDPNGTRPYSWREIGSVITAPLPAGLLNLQAYAAMSWLTGIRVATPGETQEMHAHIARLITRIVPTRSDEADGGVIYRMPDTASKAEVEQLLSTLRAGQYSARPDSLGERWAADVRDVLPRIRSTDTIMLSCAQYTSRRRIDGLCRALGDESIHLAQGVSIMPASVRYRVTEELPGEANERGGYNYTFNLEEI